MEETLVYVIANKRLYYGVYNTPRGYSSAGRALEWHSRGQRFDPAYLHHENPVIFEITGFFRFQFFVGAMQQGVK